MPWRPGARRLLTDLHQQGVPCALVTMSWRPLVDAVLEALAPIRFEAVITGDAVTNGKPHPEPYVRAAAELGVDPVQCVAIEDSPTGVTSAAAAGCVVVAVPNLVEIQPAAGRYIIPSLRDVTPEHLGAMVAAAPPPTVPRAGGSIRDSATWRGTTVADRADRHRSRAGRAGAGRHSSCSVVTTMRRRDALACSTCTPGRPTGRSRTRCPHCRLAPTRSTRSHRCGSGRPVSTRSRWNRRRRPTPRRSSCRRARRRGVPVIPSVFDRTEAGVMAGILADPAQRARHVDALVEFAAEGDYEGLDIDYEQFAFADGKDSWAATRPNWVAFVGELAARLHAEGRTLAVSIPPVYDAGQTDDSGYWVYDYAAITPLVDAIRVMAYDYSNASTDEGPVAPLDWVERVIAGTSAASGDPSKLVLGVPLYGYNWPIAVTGTCPTSAEGVTTVTNVRSTTWRSGAAAYPRTTRRAANGRSSTSSSSTTARPRARSCATSTTSTPTEHSCACSGRWTPASAASHCSPSATPTTRCGRRSTPLPPPSPDRPPRRTPTEP